MPKKVTYIISNIDRWIAFEWIIENIDRSIVDLNFILINSKDSYFEKYLIDHDIQFVQFNYNSKTQLIWAIFRTAKILRHWKTNIVHTHFLDANIIGLTAARLVGIKNRIYTRHHSIFHHQYAKTGIYWDKICNRLATKIISISSVVTKTLIQKEKVSPMKIEMIHHGFDLLKFRENNRNGVQHLKVTYDLTSKFPVIGVVSRHIEWKGVQYTIEAFKDLIYEYPEAVLFLANARGSYHKELIKIAHDIPEKNIRWVPFEKDIYSLFHLFDVFVHVPIEPEIEAFGQIYIEALATETPSIFTISGIANDFIKNEKNALVVTFKNSKEILNSMKRIIADPGLVNKITKNGLSDIKEQFDLTKMISNLNILYKNLC